MNIHDIRTESDMVRFLRYRFPIYDWIEQNGDITYFFRDGRTDSYTMSSSDLNYYNSDLRRWVSQGRPTTR